jgi:hypothetical protein
MFKLLLMSVVFVPVLMGMRAAASRGARRGLSVLLALDLAYATFYILMLYYLRMRWIG